MWVLTDGSLPFFHVLYTATETLEVYSTGLYRLTFTTGWRWKNCYMLTTELPLKAFCACLSVYFCLKEKALESLWGVSQVTWLSQLKGSVRTGPSVCHIWRLCRQSSVSGPCQLGSHQKVRMLHHWPCQLGLRASPTVNSWHSQPRRPLDRHALASDSSEMCKGAWRHQSKARHSWCLCATARHRGD